MEETSDSLHGAVVATALVSNSSEHFDNFTEALNDTFFSCCRGDVESCSAKLKFYSLFLPVIIAFTVVTSVVSCLVTSCAPWVKRPMSPSVRLSLSLSAANTFFSLTWTLYLVNMYLRTVLCLPVPGCLMLTLEVLRLGTIVVQVLHLLAVALSHYLGSLRPLHYSTTATPAALRLTLAVVWMLPMVGMVVVFASVPGQGYQSPQCSYNSFYEREVTFRLVWSCVFFGPTVVIVLVYCHIFYLLRQRSVYLQDTHLGVIQHFNVKMVRLSAMFVVTFLLGWGPAVAKFVLVCDNCLISDLPLTINMYLGAAFNMLYTLKVFTDTFIYAVRLPAVRKALEDMLMDMCGCGRSTRHRVILHHRSATSHRTISFSLSMYTTSSIQRLLEGVRASIQGHNKVKGSRRGSLRRTRTQGETETETPPDPATPQRSLPEDAAHSAHSVLTREGHPAHTP